MGFVALTLQLSGICFAKYKINPMKIACKTKDGDRHEALLKEYFITASLIALLKRVGEEAAKAAPRRANIVALAKVRN